MNDRYWMEQALGVAKDAAACGEVPVGALCVFEGKLLALAGNGSIARCDPTAHAEILVLREAAQKKGNYRLPGVTLYVTLEPCAMCVGALIHARIQRLVFGALDPRTGSVVSVRELLSDPSHNHRISYESGLCAEESAKLLRNFFQSKR
jgi:tRNA(adenine34) deaminase